MTKDEVQFLQLALGEIQSDVKYIKDRIEKNEDYTHHINKRLQIAENKISYIQGGFYIFIGVIILIFYEFKFDRKIKKY